MTGSVATRPKPQAATDTAGQAKRQMERRGINSHREQS